MARTKRDAAKERFWRGVLQRASASELSVRAFCRRENVPESAFYFWRREIARRDREACQPAGPSPRTPRRPARGSRGQGQASTSSRPSRRSPRRPEFLPVRLTDRAAHDGSITLELAGGRVLRLPETMPAERLAEIVAALETRAVTKVAARAAP